LLQSCPALCNPIDGSPPGSPVPGILQARTLEWVSSWEDCLEEAVLLLANQTPSERMTRKLIISE